MKTIKLLITTIILNILQGCNINNDLIYEIKKYRALNNETMIDITKILNNYIDKNKSWKNFNILLNKNDFLCYEDNTKKENHEIKNFICENDLRIWYKFVGFGDVVRINIKIENDSILEINGSIIYQHL